MTEEELAEQLRELVAEELPYGLVVAVEDDPPGFTIEFPDQRFRVRVVQL